MGQTKRKNKNYKNLLLLVFIGTFWQACQTENKTVWQIGEADNSCTEFALAPGNYENFVENDFGWEDKFYLINYSSPDSSWPYVLPGPSDKWGGTWSTSGWRSHTLNILFGIEKLPKTAEWKLVVDIFDIAPEDAPVFKITINTKTWKYKLPPGSGNKTIGAESTRGKEHLIEIPVPAGLIKRGGNEISFTILQGSWLLFDHIRLEGPEKTRLTNPQKIFLRNVEPAAYEIENEQEAVQPLLVDIEHLEGISDLTVLLDGEQIFSENVEEGRYVFEAPMPAVTTSQKSKIEVFTNNQRIYSGNIIRDKMTKNTLANYVDTKMGTAHSRWMIAPGPWMPFSMVKLSPDNQNGGWQAGYDPIFESIAGFSHIHEWTMAGLLVMPTNGTLKTREGDQFDPDSGYRSRINIETEEAPIGYYKADLSDYNISAELTATTRCGFHRYTFPADSSGSRILLDLSFPAEYHFRLQEVFIKKVNDYRIEGYSKQLSPNTWSGGVSQEYTMHFVVEFDQPIKKMGAWTEEGTLENIEMLQKGRTNDAGVYAEFDTNTNPVVQIRTGISFVSIENASLNLETEISNPFGWDFENVRKNNVDTWNDIFNRLKITTSNALEKKRFYTNMYRALCSRNTFSDVDGKWVDAEENIQQLTDPDALALGCDAFWNTFWNLNQFWNLVTPEWSNRWVKSQLAIYDANGWLAKGPAGMEFIPVMVAEHEIPLIVGAYQMGIRDYDIDKAYEAVKKMQTTPAQKVGGGLAGNRDLIPYLKHQYVPYDKGRFSNTLEYSFDDWTVAQFAKSIGNEHDYKEFLKRGNYWKNVIDTETGYARMKDSKGNWLADFDPYKSGANEHYVEGNAWQLTFFVPQDVPELAKIIGKDRFIERLDWGFTESDKTRYNGKNDQYWNYPVIQGNQQSMHFAYLFNWVGKPWLTQKWSRAILERYYGYGLSNAYLGDEDQGQMSAWFIMVSLGLFQTDGGCRAEPIYEIGSPLFEKTVLDLGNRFGRGEKFIIVANNASRRNKYVQSALLNGKSLTDFKFPAKDLLHGGLLELQMGPEPNKHWGNQ